LETRLAIREARHFQEAMSELAEDDPELFPAGDIAFARLDDAPERLAESERKRFAISIDTQRRWQCNAAKDEAFRKWRERAKELGVFVLLKRMPWRDCRGISLWDTDLLPLVIVNSTDTPSARIFTLFHEYAHLLLRESATCSVSSDAIARHRIERWCNSFAAAFLMPRDEVLSTIAATRTLRELDADDWELNHVTRLARLFRVSRVAMAIRLKELDISPFFDSHKQELLAFDKKKERKKRDEGGPLIPHVVRLSEVGSGAANIVLEALRGDVIDTFEAAEILDLSPEQLRRFEKRTDAQRILDVPT